MFVHANDQQSINKKPENTSLFQVIRIRILCNSQSFCIIDKLLIEHIVYNYFDWSGELKSIVEKGNQVFIFRAMIFLLYWCLPGHLRGFLSPLPYSGTIQFQSMTIRQMWTERTIVAENTIATFTNINSPPGAFGLCTKNITTSNYFLK